MKPEYIPELIAKIALADPRIRREDPVERRAQIHMWAGILADVPYDFALQAAQAHYAVSQWPIVPGDIAGRWKATVRDRLTRDNGTFEPHDHPDLDPDDITGYLQALRGQRQAVAHGVQPPNTVKALTAGPAADEVTARLRTLGTYIPRQIDDALDAHRPIKAARRAALIAGEPDALSVHCDWCQASADEPCRSRRINSKGAATANKRRTTPHPSRLDDAREAARQEARTA
ncbi:hypothetical protein ABZ733_06830 [Streptomyces longwoodensis]|uniref:zinc finger domain-containing protein n=1 Tax=Streptomyces longwoodensis TaxID=68231 RepID=UPI0033D9BFBC